MCACMCRRPAAEPGAAHDRRRERTDQFNEDGAVTILADTEDLQTTLHVAADGRLTRDESSIPTNSGDQELLREFNREAVKLADLLAEVFGVLFAE